MFQSSSLSATLPQIYTHLVQHDVINPTQTQNRRIKLYLDNSTSIKLYRWLRPPLLQWRPKFNLLTTCGTNYNTSHKALTETGNNRNRLINMYLIPLPPYIQYIIRFITTRFYINITVYKYILPFTKTEWSGNFTYRAFNTVLKI